VVNEIRTWLANMSSAPLSGPGAVPAEEYIDPRFKPATGLPAVVAAVRRLLFGADPDRWMINYRCRQFVTLLHAGPLANEVISDDPRLSYARGEDPELMPAALYAPVVVQTVGAESTLAVIGTPEAPDPHGVVHNVYEVDVLSGITVAVNRLSRPASKTVMEFMLESNLSSPLPLKGSGYRCRLSAGSVGSTWTVSVDNRPQWGIGDLLAAAKQMSSADAMNLFVNGKGKFATPWAAWNSDDVVAQLSALVLAVALRTSASGKG
jgi:hypothetical protein